VLEDKINKDTLKIETFNDEILREYDIRGLVGKNLTKNTAYSIGIKFGSIVYKNTKDKKIVVGYDGRPSSKQLQEALCHGLTESGLSVILIGLCPTPMLYFATFNLKIEAGIMVTGSHNPSEYNGFKMVLNYKPFYSTRIKDLQKNIDLKNNKEKGNFVEYNILENYVHRVLENININKKLKVAWDPGNGTIGVTIKKVLENLDNVESFLINDVVDGTFPNHHPDPTIPKNLIQIQNLVKEKNCDVGLAFDGDGDRLGIIDNQSNIIWADRYMILLTEEISKLYNNPSIIMDVKSSKVFFDEVRKMNCNPVMYKTGHSVIKDKMEEIDSPLSGEMSGHIMYKDNFYGYDDAMYVALRFLQILSKKNESLSVIMNTFPKTASTPETRFDVDESRKFKIIEEIKDRLSNMNLKVVNIDGVRVENDNGWWGIRASNTQNALTVRAEAINDNYLLKMKENIENQLKLSGVNFKFSS
tara:strand:- start:8039 stop:9454 length:1416 start_codon:yes stop_codon:yes gene_type:complete